MFRYIFYLSDEMDGESHIVGKKQTDVLLLKVFDGVKMLQGKIIDDLYFIDVEGFIPTEDLLQRANRISYFIQKTKKIVKVFFVSVENLNE